MIREIVGTEEFNAIIGQGKVLVDVYSKTCGPCKMLGFVLADVAKDMPEVEILKIDFDQNKEIIEKYEVASYPTLILFKDGVEVERLKGLQQKPVIQKMLQA
ncbi:MAG: thioredoxin family protein [Cellulosilyticaceae bacterium]